MMNTPTKRLLWVASIVVVIGLAYQNGWLPIIGAILGIITLIGTIVLLWAYNEILEGVEKFITGVFRIMNLSPLKEVLIGALITAGVSGIFWTGFGKGPEWIKEFAPGMSRGGALVWASLGCATTIVLASLFYGKLVPAMEFSSFRKAALLTQVFLLPFIAHAQLAGDTDLSTAFQSDGNSIIAGHDWEGQICAVNPKDDASWKNKQGMPGDETGHFCITHGVKTKWLNGQEVGRAKSRGVNLVTKRVDDAADYFTFSSGSRATKIQAEEWKMTVWVIGKYKYSVTYKTPLPPPVTHADGTTSMQYVTDTGDKGWIKLDQNGDGTWVSSGTGTCSLKLNEQKTCWSGPWEAETSRSRGAKGGTFVITKQ